MKDKIKEVRIIKRPGVTIKVNIPDITDEERERRMKIIKAAAASFLMSVERQKALANQNKT